jgi:hypothetical protein
MRVGSVAGPGARGWMQALCYSKFREREILRIEQQIPETGRDANIRLRTPRWH